MKIILVNMKIMIFLMKNLMMLQSWINKNNRIIKKFKNSYYAIDKCKKFKKGKHYENKEINVVNYFENKLFI